MLQWSIWDTAVAGATFSSHRYCAAMANSCAQFPEIKHTWATRTGSKLRLSWFLDLFSDYVSPAGILTASSASMTLPAIPLFLGMSRECPQRELQFLIEFIDNCLTTYPLKEFAKTGVCSNEERSGGLRTVSTFCSSAEWSDTNSWFQVRQLQGMWKKISSDLCVAHGSNLAPWVRMHANVIILQLYSFRWHLFRFVCNLCLKEKDQKRKDNRFTAKSTLVSSL